MISEMKATLIGLSKNYLRYYLSPNLTKPELIRKIPCLSEFPHFTLIN